MRSSCAEPEGPALPAAVTEANKAEYLQLLVEHRLVGAIKEQIRAFRAGLAVFLTDEVPPVASSSFASELLLVTTRRPCSVV